MNSIILRTATTFLLPLLLLASLVILLRGHNEPGGGFVGGLTAAAAFLLHLLAFGPARCRELLRIAPETLTAIGLIVALLSGMPALLADEPLFAAAWTDYEPIPGVKVGTPLIFDVGVYLTVMGSVLLMILPIAEWNPGSAETDEAPTEDGLVAATMPGTLEASELPGVRDIREMPEILEAFDDGGDADRGDADGGSRSDDTRPGEDR